MRERMSRIILHNGRYVQKCNFENVRPNNPYNHANSIPTHNEGNNNSDVKLLEIKITLFNGDYRNWRSFFDLFTSVIHNIEVSPTQKFY